MQLDTKLEQYTTCKHGWAPHGICADCGVSLVDIEAAKQKLTDEAYRREIIRVLGNRYLRNLVRDRAGVGRLNRYPIFVEENSNRSPRLDGKPWQYVTRTGIPIQYPSAYSKVGWSSMVYKSSTMRILVGVDWLYEQAMPFEIVYDK